MAARLEWRGDELRLGPFLLAWVATDRSPLAYTIVMGGIPETMGAEAKDCESKDDAMQDCESEVRRLLKDAGVEIEP